jgi:hypothetical protein
MAGSNVKCGRKKAVMYHSVQQNLLMTSSFRSLVVGASVTKDVVAYASGVQQEEAKGPEEEESSVHGIPT